MDASSLAFKAVYMSYVASGVLKNSKTGIHLNEYYEPVSCGHVKGYSML